MIIETICFISHWFAESGFEPISIELPMGIYNNSSFHISSPKRLR
jgi:hypothetical protein